MDTYALYAYMPPMTHEPNMHDAHDAGPRGKQVSGTTTFSRKDFARGVDDALTLAPLRHAVTRLRVLYFTKKAHTAAKAGRSVEPVNVPRDTSARTKR